jgi:hypothetical protein
MSTESLDSKKFIRNPGFVSSWIDDELVMMSIETGKYYTLNRTATAIWNALDQAKSLNDVVNILIQQFDVPEQICRQDVETCLKTVVNHQLVTEAS